MKTTTQTRTVTELPSPCAKKRNKKKDKDPFAQLPYNSPFQAYLICPAKRAGKATKPAHKPFADARA